MKASHVFGLVLALLGAFALSPADAQTSGRSQKWEVTGQIRYLLSEGISFEGGSSIDTDDDLGWGFGAGYNVNEHLLLGGEFGFSRVDYDGSLASGDDPPEDNVSINGEFDTAYLGFNATWHFLTGPITPYVTGAIGWQWVDTNIATGPPVTGCWWDPWFGYICDSFVDTADEDDLAYSAALGLRWDFDRQMFVRAAYEERWVDFEKANGTPSLGLIKVEFGTRF